MELQLVMTNDKSSFDGSKAIIVSFVWPKRRIISLRNVVDTGRDIDITKIIGGRNLI